MDDDKFVHICLKEMFKRVGEKYPNEELTKQKDWFSQRTWTEKDQENFKKWLEKKMAKQWSYLGKRKIELEAAMFILMWGWRCEDKK